MEFSLNKLIGKTIQIDDVTADVEQVVENRYLKLTNFSKYKNTFHHEDTYSKLVEWYNEDETSYSCEFDPLITIPSSYSNVYIEFDCIIYLYISTLPESIPHVYELVTSGITITAFLNTEIYEINSTTTPFNGTYDGISKNSDDPGSIYFIVNISSGLLTNRWYRLSLNVSNLRYKNCRGEVLINGEGCLPKSYISKRISVISHGNI